MGKSSPAKSFPALRPPLDIETVHIDSRGETYRVVAQDVHGLIFGGRELMLFYCLKGGLRGGHYHDADEVVMVLSGKVRYHKMVGGQPTTQVLAEGDTVLNKAGEPHMGEFLEDSWVLDWKVGPKAAIGAWSTTDYQPFREQVRERLALLELGRKNYYSEA